VENTVVVTIITNSQWRVTKTDWKKTSLCETGSHVIFMLLADSFTSCV